MYDYRMEATLEPIESSFSKGFTLHHYQMDVQGLWYLGRYSPGQPPRCPRPQVRTRQLFLPGLLQSDQRQYRTGSPSLEAGNALIWVGIRA